MGGALLGDTRLSSPQYQLPPICGGRASARSERGGEGRVHLHVRDIVPAVDAAHVVHGGI